MKTLKAKIEISEETKKAIETFIRLSEKFKKAYFWASPSSAAQRRKMEEGNYFDYAGDNIELEFYLEVSAKNVYVRKSILVNEESKNITSLKNLLK